MATGGVGVGFVSGVVRSLMTLYKSKIGVVRGAISATGIITFPFLPTPFTTTSLTFRL